MKFSRSAVTIIMILAVALVVGACTTSSPTPSPATSSDSPASPSPATSSDSPASSSPSPSLSTSQAPVAVAPAANFLVPSGTIITDQPVQFTDASTGNPTSWSWNFGDGETDAFQNPTHAFAAAGSFTVTLTAGNSTGSSNTSRVVTVSNALASLVYSIVDTGQTKFWDQTGAEIAKPTSPADQYYGEDAQYSGVQPSYTKSSDSLTVKDNVTGLTWQQSPDTNGDSAINASDKFSWTNAQARPAALNAAKYGGYNDWRLPTIKELYSLINFMGADPSGISGSDTSGLTPFIDTSYFNFSYGDTSAGERIIDSQYASSTLYANTTMLGDATLFGVNFADGRIKGYGLTMMGGQDKTFFVQCARGDVYGVNDFADNSDGAVTDRATGLMWTKEDSAKGLNWQEALAWTQTKNAANYLGHSDWRLPNAKELQSLVDYSRSPDTTSSAAIDPLFTCTGITNEAGQADYPFYWTGTTHVSSGGTGGAAIYIAFGRAMGCMTDPSGSGGAWLDVHGAGSQRSDPKEGNAADFPTGRGPQGDAIRIYNFVRLVRDAQ